MSHVERRPACGAAVRSRQPASDIRHPTSCYHRSGTHTVEDKPSMAQYDVVIIGSGPAENPLQCCLSCLGGRVHAIAETLLFVAHVAPF